MRVLTILLTLAASPALAASGPFFSLRNTDFVVTVSFLIFLGVLVYFKVPGLLGGLLDKRAATIKAELDEARALREEAQAVLASYERKHKEVQEQADRIVATAKREAEAAAEEAKAKLAQSIERRLKAAEEQIASAEAAAVRDVRDRAIVVAVGAAGDILKKQLKAADRNKLIEDSLADIKAKLH